MRAISSFIALNRFGMGARPGDEETLRGAPRGWLNAQVRRDRPALPVYGRLRSSEQILRAIFEGRRTSPQAQAAAVRRAYRRDFYPSLVTRARLMIASDTPFADRMLLFWSNHFSLSTTRRISGAAIPAFEREVIAPHVFGRFSDMLRAAARHPCMLIYLDNVASMGPNSPLGIRRRQRGNPGSLNENFARELLELHTLGVDGGYTQDDIVELAKALTGWGHGGIRLGNQEAPVHGRFQFFEIAHEPGARRILGQAYPEGGAEQGLAVLDDLARHPSTARHIARKLARHFIADDPPEPAITHIAQVFAETDGDLAAVSRAIIALDAAWADPLAKVKTPYEFVIGVHRAAGRIRARRQEINEPLRVLGQVPFSAPSPQGWSDRAGDWIAPQSLMRRIEWTRRLAATLPSSLAPADFLEAVIGPVASADVRLWVARAPSHDAGLAMIFASPEFQRR